MNLPISEEEISVARKQLSKGKSPGPSHITYEFLINGGPAMLSSLTKLFNDIFQSETQPIQWQQSHLINLGKGKGEREKLSSKRGITLSECPAKVFGKVLHKVRNASTPAVTTSHHMCRQIHQELNLNAALIGFFGHLGAAE